MKTWIAFLLFLFCIKIHAQDSCRGIANSTIFQSNRIGACYYPQGEKFYDGAGSFFKVPYTSETSPSSIFASSPWIGGYIQGELRVACQTYAGFNFQEFNPGPLNPNAEVPMDLCRYFDRVWEVSRSEIESHIKDYNTDGMINDSLVPIFGWPAQGNKFFSEFNGFALPASHRGGWAEFEDLNHNGLYEPDLGEYPIVKLKGTEYIPEQMMWMVFNDVGPHDQTLSPPLGIEIQLTVYGFNCIDNYVLNNTLFNTYKIINQNETSIDSLYFGMWSDYDLGCSEDDYMGSDSTRNTEFVYNQDSIDGDQGMDCSTGATTYATLSPVQSMTYLSPPMNSFITMRLNPDSAIEYYRLLKGLWKDGTPITAHGSGYNPGESYPVTKFLFHGDPRDSSQWALSNLSIQNSDTRSVSSVALGSLEPYDSAIIETAYQFHLDDTLNNLEQIEFMNQNIDYLKENLNQILSGCSQFPHCEGKDCVWPGDFNNDGIADLFDLLDWGVMKDSDGPKRNGIIAWEGLYADNWLLTLPDGTNSKHGDGNGNGTVDIIDLDRNTQNSLLKNSLYDRVNKYPVGTEIILSSDTIDSQGRIKNLKLIAGKNIQNVLGLAYEIEFDTSIFQMDIMRINWPADSNSMFYYRGGYIYTNRFTDEGWKFSAVQTDHQGILIEKNKVLESSTFNGLHLISGLTLDDVPDSTIIRLRNLIAIDPDGNDLHIGSNTLVVYKQQVTGISDLEKNKISIYPNPARDLLFVDVPYDMPGEILNLQGQVVKQLFIGSSKPIQISDLNPGIYFLRLPLIGKVFKVAIY